MKRIETLDGLRGVLAMVVLTYHTSLVTGIGPEWLGHAATGAVWCFFVMSGFVLTRAFDGRYLIFLARRATRLLPVYSLCLAAGMVITHRHVPPLALLGWAGLDIRSGMDALVPNPPAWSLCVELFAMPFMPLIAWFGRGRARRAWLLAPVCAAVFVLPVPFYWLAFFFLGAALSRLDFRVQALEARLPQRLGELSYSLYLSHMPLFYALLVVGGRFAVLAGLPLVFGVAAVVWRYVEVPSIALSRRVSLRPRKTASLRLQAVHPGASPLTENQSGHAFESQLEISVSETG